MWKPETSWGRRLLAMSEKFEGERLDQAGICEEVRLRHGGLA